MALATAVTVAATLGIGTIGYATISGGHLLGLGSASGSKSMTPVTELETITRVVVVHAADGSVVTDPAGVAVTVLRTVLVPRVVPAGGASAAPPVASPSATAPVATPAPTTGTTTTTTSPPSTTPPSTPPSTTIRRSTTTTVKSTATTLPKGVPADWPVGKPIPPMPPGCEQPQLELNGVWNCG